MKLEAKFLFLLTIRNVFCTCLIQEGDVRTCAWRVGLRFECWLNKRGEGDGLWSAEIQTHTGVSTWECRVRSIKIKYVDLKSCFYCVKILCQVKCIPQG